MEGVIEQVPFDLSAQTVRELNQFLHQPAEELAGCEVVVTHPNGAHNIAVGLNAPVHVTVQGHAGYYAAGMKMHADLSHSERRAEVAIPTHTSRSR